MGETAAVVAPRAAEVPMVEQEVVQVARILSGRPIEWESLYSGEVRWRFGGWLYTVGQGGTLPFPASDGTPRPGAFASLSLGVDHAR